MVVLCNYILQSLPCVIYFSIVLFLGIVSYVVTSVTSYSAVAVYFIDKLALRAGNEKDSDETADTVGCCSLRVEHLSKYSVKFALCSV